MMLNMKESTQTEPSDGLTAQVSAAQVACCSLYTQGFD